MRIDLHQHSICSDGALTPAALIDRARRLGYRAAALTDHDTMRGVPEFLAAARAAGIRALSGVELSCTAGGGEVHILGYGLDDPGEALAPFGARRLERMRRMLARLADLGIVVGEEELAALGTSVPTRRHLARLLAQKGYAADPEEAFARYLSEGGSAWVGWSPVAPEEAVETIRALGGVAVLAHPGRTRLDDATLERLVRRLCGAGLGGIECYYLTHTSADAQKYRALAARHGLLATNGSDFHREGDPHGGGAFAYARAEAETVRALGLGAL